ncbi:uncharacterized protein AruCF_3766 [Achromobacter ruhlandii]|nr:uncharacterized protein AruCF_3766 [Achromobacter ruhlandii]
MFAAARANYQEFHCCVILKVASRVSSDTCPRDRPRIRAGPDPVTAWREEARPAARRVMEKPRGKPRGNYCASSKTTVV